MSIYATCWHCKQWHPVMLWWWEVNEASQEACELACWINSHISFWIESPHNFVIYKFTFIQSQQPSFLSVQKQSCKSLIYKFNFSYCLCTYVQSFVLCYRYNEISVSYLSRNWASFVSYYSLLFTALPSLLKYNTTWLEKLKRPVLVAPTCLFASNFAIPIQYKILSRLVEGSPYYHQASFAKSLLLDFLTERSPLFLNIWVVRSV